ncbi:MAG: ABC transporter permease family protein, partial [Planctomycetota bacterium]
MADAPKKDYKPTKGLSGVWGNAPVFAILSVWSAFSLFSVLWIVYTSLKSDYEFTTKSPWALPESWQWVNYKFAWTVAKIGSYTLNSVIVTIASVTLIVLISAMTAYAITKIEWRGSQLFFYYFLAGLAVPASLLLVPLFMLLKNFNIEQFNLFSVGGYWLISIENFFLVDSRLGL